MRSGDLIREARLRAGLTQYELAERSGRERSVIARWEQGTVAPSVETLVELVRACGFDLPLELVPLEPPRRERAAAQERAPLTPSGACSGSSKRRQQKRPAGAVSADQQPFDPYAILAALERQRVTYVLIGGFARVIQGTEELTHGLDLAPSLRAENLRRLGLALDDLGAERVDGKPTRPRGERRSASEPLIELASPRGRAQDRPRAGRHARRLRRPPPRRHPRADRQRPAPLGRLDRRPRPHARRPRPRTRPATLRQLRQLLELERGLSRSIER